MNNEYLWSTMNQYRTLYFKRMSKANRDMRRDIIRQNTDAKQISKLQIEEKDDYDLMIARMQSKVNHRFLVMRAKKKS